MEAGCVDGKVFLGPLLGAPLPFFTCLSSFKITPRGTAFPRSRELPCNRVGHCWKTLLIPEQPVYMRNKERPKQYRGKLV